MIDSKQAAAALSDIDDIVRRVRQSRTYAIASGIMIWWGVLVLSANLANYGWPHHDALIWPAFNIVGVVGTILIGALMNVRSGMRGFERRMLAAYLLFFAFGYLCSQVLGHFGPRQLGAFWPIYFMLFYILAGLWFGRAFMVIGVAITALTLIGYFHVLGAAFLLWMAAVNGGGLILGGLWMRWN